MDINKQNRNNMFVNIPFDHIKILDDGNFGCTLKLGNEIYCAICTPSWKVVKPLHKVDKDPYSDYTYIRDKVLRASSYQIDDEINEIDEYGAFLFEYDAELTDNDVVDAYIDDYISRCPVKGDEMLGAIFFSIRYIKTDGSTLLTLENVLTPYSTFGPSAIKEMLFKYRGFRYNKEKFAAAYDITGTDDTPIQQEALKIMDWAGSVKRSFERVFIDDRYLDILYKNAFQKHVMLEYIRELFEAESAKDICENGLYRFPIMIYLEYIKQYAPEMCDSDTLMF